jgi:hypothetical protein
MYKPNGEERMSDQEERQRRDQITQRRIERMHAASSVAEVLGTTVYASLVQSSMAREEAVGVRCDSLR